MPTFDETRALARKHRAALKPVSELITSVLDEDPSPHFVGAAETARGLLDRLGCWLGTMQRLERLSDFQAHLAGMRATMELTVDLAFVHHDPLLDEQLRAWERSALLHQAKNLREYAENHEVFSAGEELRKFVTNHGASIAAERLKYWGDAKKHPSRWTKRDLPRDVQIADGYYRRLKLEKLYQQFYRFACWNIHGSGLAGFRTMGEHGLLSVSAVAFLMVGELGLAGSELAMRLVGKWTEDHRQRLHEADGTWTRITGRKR